MTMLMTPFAIAKMAEMPILAIMATIVIAYVNFSMAIRGIKLKILKKYLNEIGFT